MFTKKELSQDEKIDYIYKTLKRQNQYKIFKFILFIFIIVFIYFYSWYLIEQLKQKLVPDFVKTISPIIKDISSDLIKDMAPKNSLEDKSIEDIKNKINSLIK